MPQEPSLRGPISDRKNYIGKSAGVFRFQCLSKVVSRPAGIIVESAATPRTEHGDLIVKWVREFKDVEDRCRVVTNDEIKEEGWTLNISRYVLPPIGEDIPPLPEAVAAFKKALVEARAAE